jgi:hypothetical protein
MPLGFGQFPPQSYRIARQMSARLSGHPTVGASLLGLVEPAVSAWVFTASIPHPVALDAPPVDAPPVKTTAWTSRPREGYESPKDVFGGPRQ